MNLYHYCSTNSFFNIIKSNELWLSDIAHSNDYMELQILNNRLFSKLILQFIENPFNLVFSEFEGLEALKDLIREAIEYINYHKNEGTLNCYSICFSEEGDLLSQWRGYADDSKGFAIGFSKEIIQEYVIKNDFLELVKVQYLSDAELDKYSENYAKEILDILKDFRSWLIEEMQAQDHEIDGLLSFNFTGMITSVIFDSVSFKHESFKEEKEWRLFVKELSTKSYVKEYNDKKIYGSINSEAIKQVQKRMNFYSSNDQIKSYVGMKFKELTNDESNLIREIKIGSKNYTTTKDLELFLNKHKIKSDSIMPSVITYT